MSDEEEKKASILKANDWRSSSFILLEEVLRVEAEMNKCKTDVNDSLEIGTARMDKIGVQVNDVAESLEELTKRIETLIGIFEAGEKFFKVIGWIGKAVKWTAIFGGSIAAILYFFKTGSWHK